MWFNKVPSQLEVFDDLGNWKLLDDVGNWKMFDDLLVCNKSVSHEYKLNTAIQ
jgi:hypothetical protein